MLLGTINLFQIHLCWRNENLQGIRLLNKHRCCRVPAGVPSTEDSFFPTSREEREKRERSLRPIVYLLNVVLKQRWLAGGQARRDTFGSSWWEGHQLLVPSRDGSMWFCAFTKKWAEWHVWFKWSLSYTSLYIRSPRSSPKGVECWLLLSWRWHMSWRWHRMQSFRIVDLPRRKNGLRLSLLPFWNFQF